MLRSVDRAAAGFIRAKKKTNLLQNLSSVHFIIQPLHIWGVSVAYHQEVLCMYTTVGTDCCTRTVYLLTVSRDLSRGCHVSVKK